MKKCRLQRQVSCTLGVSWRRMMRRCHSKKTQNEPPRHKLSLPKDTVDSVQSFYIMNATPLPYKKAYCKKTGKTKLFVSKTIDTLYKDFKLEYPLTTVGRSMFHKLRPANVKLASEQTLDQGLCEYCTNTNLKLRAINRLADTHKVQDCKIPDVYRVVEIIMCPKALESKFFKNECLDRSW